MELRYENKDKKHFVYGLMKGYTLIANPTDRAFVPGFSYVCVSTAEFGAIREIVKKAITSGTVTATGTGKKKVVYTEGTYQVSIITLDRGQLVDVRVIDEQHELCGLSLVWIVDPNGNTSFKSNDQAVYFTNNGMTRFNMGYQKVHAKIATSRYDAVSKTFVEDYSEPRFITIPEEATVDGALRMARGLQLLETVSEFAASKISGVDTNGAALPGDVPMAQ